MSGMSTEIEEQTSAVQAEESSAESSKRPLKSYTREFLLSLSELEVCKKLPKEFDESLLSEFEGASVSSLNRQRVPGGSSLPVFKRTDYGSSGPPKGEGGSYGRGVNRWDTRSSGRSDNDIDSELGRRYGGQARRSWQSPPEHDGLLGSGSFPRPAGYAAGATVPRFRPNENSSLNRSNEPYHPPRPYKATPHSRREANDSFNDETFGSADDASEDRVEEEKKRKAEFEQMREQQHKALQEKQKSSKGKTDDLFSEAALLGNPSDGKTSSDNDQLSKPALQDDSSKLSVSSQAPLSRPLVPPGFVSSVVDKSSISKPPVNAESLLVGKLEPEDIRQDVKTIASGRGSSELHSQTSSTSVVKAENVLNLPSVLHGADHTKGPRLPDASEILENGEIMGLDFEVTGPKLLGVPPRSTSILDKLFGTTITASDDNTDNFVEDDAKGGGDGGGEIQSSDTSRSKFAGWFPEENRKPASDISSEKPNNLFSLIVGSEKGESNVPASSGTRSNFSLETMIDNKTLNSASSSTELSEPLPNSYATEAKPAVLTCEDLEQSMLSEIGGASSNTHPAVKEDHASEMKIGHIGNNIDNQASHHLLSLLQKGSGSNDVASISVAEKRPEKLYDHEVGKVGARDINVNDADGLKSPGKALTLESLFGTAFMKELHSAQRNTVGSAKLDASEAAFFPSAMNGSNHVASKDRIEKLDNVGEWLGLNDALKDMELSKQPPDSKFGSIDRGMDVGLPEEDSLINLIDPVRAEKSMLAPNSGTFNSDLLPSSSSMPADIREKLAALGGTPDERSMVGGHDPRLLHGFFDMAKSELSYQNLHPRPSSPQLHSSQMNHSRPLYHALDSHPAHLDPQLNFMPPEPVMHRDAPTHHQFPANMGHPSFPHPSSGLPGFDHPIPSPILQQMQMAGNLPPPHLARGFPGSAPMPPRHSPAGYVQEPNPLQNFPFSQRQPYFGGPGMGQTGPEFGVSNNPPEAFQRLLEMELRANPKQMHPFADGSPSRPMYGHELDTGFRYR